MIPKLIALDLDGTLLTSDLKVSNRTRNAVQALKAKSVRVVLCTGRPPRYTQALAEELGLGETVIVFNGASIHNFVAETALHLHQLTASTASQVIETLRAAHPQVLTGLETSKGWFLDEALYRQNRSRIEKHGSLPDGYGDSLEFLSTFTDNNSVIKILVRHPELNAFELAKPLQGLNVYTIWSHSSLLEVQHKSVSKRAALIHLCDALKLDKSQVAAFGDQNNDIEMLTWAGYGVAMGNGCAAAKQSADFITSSNDEDGVAKVLETWL